MDATLRETKLTKLLEIEGLDSIDDLARESLFDDRPGTPAICMNDGCNYTADMEPDQGRGYCEECRTNTMASALVLAGLI
jgi:hypothetical protein